MDMNPSNPRDDILRPVSYVWLSGKRIPIYSVSILSGDFDPEMLVESLRNSRPVSYPYDWHVFGELAVVLNMIDLQQSSSYSTNYQQRSSSYSTNYQQRSSSYSTNYQQRSSSYSTNYQQRPSSYSTNYQQRPSSYSTYYDQQRSLSYSTYYQQPQEEEEEEEEEAIEDDEVARLNTNQINDSFEQASNQMVASSGLTDKFISQNLTLTKYRHKDEEEESDDDEICVVCQAEFENEERVGMLQCRHRFHPECIKEWLLYKNVCPLCKSEALNV